MGFKGVRMIPINELQLTQIYLSQKKMQGVSAWFDRELRHFEPLPVRDFLNNGNLHLTDGHTRAFTAWRSGIKKLPAVYDEDDIVACELGQLQYENSIAWCGRFGLDHIARLGGRILDEAAYQELWMGRCDRMQHMAVALLNGTLDRDAFETERAALEKRGQYIYGLSQDLAAFYCEDKQGRLFMVPRM